MIGRNVIAAGAPRPLPADRARASTRASHGRAGGGAARHSGSSRRAPTKHRTPRSRRRPWPSTPTIPCGSDVLDPSRPQRAGGARRRARLAQLRAADGRRAARARRPRRLLDVLVRQLAADPALRQGVARAVSRPRARRRRRARAGVRVRARPRQRAPRGRRAGRRLPGRHRQRLRHLAVVREPLLAGGLPRRSRRASPLPPLRRGRLRGDRASDPAAAGRRRGNRPRRRRRPRRGGRLGDAAVPGDLPGLRPRRAPQRPARRRARAQPVGARRRVVGGRGGRRARSGRRFDRVPLPGARPQPGPRAAGLGRPGPLHRAPRRSAARR